MSEAVVKYCISRNIGPKSEIFRDYPAWDEAGFPRPAESTSVLLSGATRPTIAGLCQATERTGMEISGGGISSERWTDVSDCDIDHGAPRTVAGLTAPRYQATERTGSGGGPKLRNR